jgi:hypothetical protein
MIVDTAVAIERSPEAAIAPAIIASRSNCGKLPASPGEASFLGSSRIHQNFGGFSGDAQILVYSATATPIPADQSSCSGLCACGKVDGRDLAGVARAIYASSQRDAEAAAIMNQWLGKDV